MAGEFVEVTGDQVPLKGPPTLRIKGGHDQVGDVAGPVTGLAELPVEQSATRRQQIGVGDVSVTVQQASVFLLHEDLKLPQRRPEFVV